MIRMFRQFLLVGVMVIIAGCGGGSGSTPRLVSVTVSVSNPVISFGSTARMIATGTYTDNSHADLTSTVVWSSSNAAVATISNNTGNSGVVTTVSGGTSTITAALGAVSGSTAISVVPVGGTIQGAPLSLKREVKTITNATAQLSWPMGITTDGINLFVTDPGFNNDVNVIRKIEIASGNVSIFAGLVGQGATVDGIGTKARFDNPRGITTDGAYLYVTEIDSRTIRKIKIPTSDIPISEVSTISTPDKISSPAGITTDGINLFVTNPLNHTISKIDISTNIISTIAGTSGVSGFDNKVGTSATFNQPTEITTDGKSLYIVDLGNNVIRKVEITSGVVSTVATGFTTQISSITTDGTNLYVTDYANTVRTIVINTGVITTLAGDPNLAPGLADGSAALFNQPEGCTSNGKSLFVSDRVNHAIREIK